MSASVYVDPDVREVQQLYDGLFDEQFYSLPIRRQLELQAERMRNAHHNQNDSVCFQIASWHPTLVGKADAQILSSTFTMEDAKTTIAREYGFKGWNEVESIGEQPSDVDFEGAVNTMLSGGMSSLKEQIGRRPDLLRARSRYGHRATLLHYAGTNGVESYRQVVPLNLSDIIDFLIASGADHECQANIYGGSTFRALFESSKHSYESKVHNKVIESLKKYETKHNG